MLIAPNPSGGPLRVLSIDGGGVRGLMNAEFLARLEDRLESSLQRHFDVIAGTSTGALLAVGLARPFAAHEHFSRAAMFAEVYRDQASDIFPSHRTRMKRLSSLRQRPEENGPLESVLSTFVGQSLLRDTAVEVVVPAFDIDESETVVFTRAEALEPASEPISLAEVARASAAAPTYLPSVRIEWRARTRRLVDGGVVANNPALLTVLALRAAFPRRTIRVLSLGTGTRGRRFAERAHERDPWNWRYLLDLSKSLLDANGPWAATMVTQLLGPDCHLRIDHEFDGDVPGLDDARPDTIEALAACSERTWALHGEAVINWLDSR